MKVNNAMKASGLALALIWIQACGISVDASRSDYGNYASYTISELDFFGDISRELETGCIDLDDGPEAGTITIEDRDYNEIEFRYRYDNERLAVDVYENDEQITAHMYMKSFLLNGSVIEQQIETTRGQSFLMQIEGPECDY